MKKRLLLIAVLALLAALFIVPSALAATRTYTNTDGKVEVHSLNEGDILMPGVTIYQNDQVTESKMVEWGVYIAAVEGKGSTSWKKIGRAHV